MPRIESDNFIGRTIASAKADPKKAAALSLLLVVLIGMWIKMAMGDKTLPQPASAATSSSSLPPVPTAPNARSRSVAANNSLQDWLAAPAPADLSRNLFDIKLEYFPVDGSRPTEHSRTPDQTFWGRLAKSVSAQADQEQKRKNLIQNLRQQAGQLQLQSTVMGANPKAIVNGALVGEGNVVASFRVLKIEARRIIVEREGIKLEIPMK